MGIADIPACGEVTVEDLVKKGAARKGHPVKVSSLPSMAFL